MSGNDKRKFFTLMIVPHAEGAVKRIRIPWLWIHSGVVFLVGMALLATYFYYDYGRVKESLPELYRLREVNQQQQQEIEGLADQATDLQEKLTELDQLEMKVREFLDSSAQDTRVRPATVVASRSLDRDERLSGAPAREMARGGIEDNEAQALVPAVANSLTSIGEQVDHYRETLEELVQSLERRQEYLDAKPSLWPTQGKVTSRFGYRSSPFGGSREFHSGIDIAAPRGTPVVATGSGVVTFSGWRSGYGYTIIIDHGYGLRTLYAHNSSLVVRTGARVTKGQLIAHVGSTGRSTGPHVHYEVHQNGNPVNPANYLP